MLKDKNEKLTVLEREEGGILRGLNTRLKVQTFNLSLLEAFPGILILETLKLSFVNWIFFGKISINNIFNNYF